MPDAGQLHLWIADLDQFTREVELTGEERDAASKFRFERDQRRYRATRMITRLVLSNYLGVEPADLVFQTRDGGKPYLQTPGGETTPLYFSLSHSDNRYLLGITRDCEIGVDIERLRPIEDAAELVKRFFHPNEARSFENLPEELQEKAFYLAWTRKEAVLKCTGAGLSAHLDSLTVTLDPRASCELLSVDPRWGQANEWTLLAPQVSEQLACAVASQAHIRQTTIFEL